ncbi:MAG: DMT family transporter [Candidatus Lokiarchaeota archaeon]|nr:DMT family transporter [Candidatus Lokiarchaeota archaeon]
MWTDPNYRRSFLITAAAPLCWSIGGLGIRSVTTNIWETVFWRALFMGLTVLVFLIARRRILQSFKRSGIPGVAAGAFLAMSMIFYVNSLSYTTVANALVLQGTAPLFAAILGWFLLRERISVGTGLAIIVVIIAMVSMVSDSLTAGMWRGDAFALGNAISLASYIIVVRRTREIDLIPAICLSGFISALVALPLMTTFMISEHDLGILSLLGAVQVGLGSCLFVTGSRNLPPAQSGLLTLLETVLGSFWVWIFIGEQPTTIALISGTIIVITLALHTILDSRPSKKFSRN